MHFIELDLGKKGPNFKERNLKRVAISKPLTSKLKETICLGL